MYRVTLTTKRNEKQVYTYDTWKSLNEDMSYLLSRGEISLRRVSKETLTRKEQHEVFVRTLDFDNTSNEEFFSKMFSDPSMLGLDGVSDGLDSDEPSYT